MRFCLTIVNGFIALPGISADLYIPPKQTFESVDKYPDNKCFCPGNEMCPPRGLQSISPCQYGKYFSFL